MITMKLTTNKSNSGSILVITVVTSAIIGSVLCSYLVLVNSRNQGTMRSLAWNTAIPVLEAGIEEALTHLQVDKNAPSANDWTQGELDGKMAYWKRRDLPDGSHYYVTNVNVASTAPFILAAGYVKAPLKDNEYVSRLVMVTTTNPPSVFRYAIAANGVVRLNGQAMVDGYDSRYPISSTNRTATGSIATNSKQEKAIDIGSGHVFGRAVTGPGGTVSVAGGSVGDLTWPMNGGLKPEWSNNDMNVQFQDNSPPATASSTLPPTQTQLGVSNITYLTQDSKTTIYKIDSFNSNSAKRPMIVTGHVTLWVTGDFIVSGLGEEAGYVYIQPGASLNLYVGGTTSISGGGVVNGTGSPANFSYNGLSSNSTLRYSGAADFIGTINAPEANVIFTGNSSVYGAIICNTFTGTGNSGIHYDQALGGVGIFMVTSWREMPLAQAQ
jgi:hypothetical protein